jgi:glycosyltransferase involved in cell wall biosynthesis
MAIRYALALRRHGIPAGSDAVEIHRSEPLLAVTPVAFPVVSVVHQDPREVLNRASDSRWTWLPKLSLVLDRFAARRATRIYSVQRETLEFYSQHVPHVLGRCVEIDTWADRSVFHPATDDLERAQLRCKVLGALGLDPSRISLVTVGRVERGKSPELLLEAFARLAPRDVNLVWIGDGTLRPTMQKFCEEKGLADRVRFAGRMSPSDVADHLRCFDLFVFSSRYDTKPMAMVEALACGLPVATVDVGNVRKTVLPGVNGEIAARADPQALAATIERCMDELPSYSAPAVVRSCADLVPAKRLADVHGFYRDLLDHKRCPQPTQPAIRPPS